MKNILLTGGAGYIGSHVCHLLIDQGYKVTCIDSLITGNKELLPKEVKLEIFDISDKAISSSSEYGKNKSNLLILTSKKFMYWSGVFSALGLSKKLSPNRFFVNWFSLISIPKTSIFKLLR